jgi:hypothetical protein
VFLSSHLINVNAIRNDDFDTYIKDRANSLYDLIEDATGKPIAGRGETNLEYLEDSATDTEEEIYL